MKLMLEWAVWIFLTYGIVSIQLAIGRYLTSAWMLPDGIAWLLACFILVAQGPFFFVAAGVLAGLTDIIFYESIGPHFFPTV